MSSANRLFAVIVCKQLVYPGSAYPALSRGHGWEGIVRHSHKRAAIIPPPYTKTAGIKGEMEFTE